MITDTLSVGKIIKQVCDNSQQSSSLEFWNGVQQMAKPSQQQAAQMAYTFANELYGCSISFQEFQNQLKQYEQDNEEQGYLTLLQICKREYVNPHLYG